MAAALLSSAPVELTNVPRLTDVNVMVDVVKQLGCQVEQDGDRLSLFTPEITSTLAPYELVSKMRASFNVLGALLGRYGEAKVSLPGGCSIGKRSVDLHVKGLQALGAEVEINHGYVEAKATKLVGTKIVLDTPSVGATENIMLASVFAEGSTVISNAAQEPEIVDLANFINVMGGDIHGAGTSEIIINGVSQDSLRDVRYSVIPDRIEAATYLIATAATKGDVLIRNVFPTHLTSVIHKLSEMGTDILIPTPNSMRIRCNRRLMAKNIVTQPYPGFPTDLQAPFMALLASCDGVSIVTETLYENRFRQVGELQRMGAQIQHEGNVAVITGVDQLSGTQVKSSDLRAGAGLIIAGLSASGQTEIFELQHIDRGYEKIVQKFEQLGANIQRVAYEEEAAPFPSASTTAEVA
jgi:UDP-N-acetylglucosamine 1-carboxyvinyltransferase